ncbi:hypothetical protein [Nocardia sp. NPDC006630]|uniref:hypothetical protein n=1 Tax=Nocardia sp. NPDC006630 TaxID=3157181 RepID=UPI0033BD7BD6
MSRVALNPLQWNSLEHIDDVRPIDDSDAACLEEIRLVLSKYGNLGRLGIALLHSHFQLADDEMMLETTDTEQREHWVRPVKKMPRVQRPQGAPGHNGAMLGWAPRDSARAIDRVGTRVAKANNGIRRPIRRVPPIPAVASAVMGGVADESDALRHQQCIDVLCGYLRLPYTPELGGTTKRFENATFAGTA